MGAYVEVAKWKEFYKAEDEEICKLGDFEYDYTVKAAVCELNLVDEWIENNSVDAVEVVRCKDCSFGIKDDFDDTWQCVKSAEYDEETDMYFGFSSYHGEDFYCAYGERRTNDA